MPTAKVNGAEIYYEESGSGPLLNPGLKDIVSSLSGDENLEEYKHIVARAAEL